SPLIFFFKATPTTDIYTLSLHDALPISKNKFGPQSKNLGSIIRGFKSSVTTDARKIDADVAWHPRFYDHIIRDYTSFINITNYINNNVLTWGKDKFNVRQLKENDKPNQRRST